MPNQALPLRVLGARRAPPRPDAGKTGTNESTKPTAKFNRTGEKNTSLPTILGHTPPCKDAIYQ